MKATIFVQRAAGVWPGGKFWRWPALLILSVTQLCLPASGSVWTWSGGGANALWNNSANWGFAGIPANGDTVIFPASQPNELNTNNIAGLVLNQVRFVGAGGGYDIRGNAFTVTNNIEATNTAGANTIENNITLATVDQSVNVAVSLTLSGVLSGAVGLVKTGAGTLLLSGPFSNTYGGTTTVNGGLVQLEKNGSPAAQAIPGNLVIGNGSVGAEVQNIYGNEFVVTANVTINNGSTWDLNGNFETVANLTIQGGTVSSETGTLSLKGNLTTLASANQASITGNLAFTGGARPIITVADGGAFYDLNCVANISDNGNGLFFTNSPAGSSWAVLGGSNTISGPIIANNLVLAPTTSYSLGATNPVTIGGNGTLWLYSSGFTNKTLTLQAGADLTAQYNNTWAGPIVLGGNVTIWVDAAGGGSITLNLAGGISGTGNINAVADSVASLLLSGSAANTFNGDLSLQTGTLQLNKSGFDGAIPHNLFIGDATHSATNRLLAVNQIGNGSTVTLYNGSLLDLNNNYEGIGSLVMYGASVTMGTGFLDMYSPGTIITPAPASTTANISGIVGLQVACTFLVSNNLTIPAQIYASGSLTKNGYGSLYLQASNTYNGLTLVQQGYLWAQNNFALGTTNNGTVVSSGATLVLTGNIGITNESLTLNGLGNPGWMALDCEYAETNAWAGPITLNADSNIGNYNSAGLLRLNGPISGADGLIEGGQPSYAGTLSLEGATANTYAGLTTVSTGTTLLLNKPGGVTAIPGNLLIDGHVYSVNGEVIANTCDMTIDPAGTYELNAGHFEDIDGLSGSGSVLMDSSSYIGVGFNNGSSTFNGTIVGPGFSSYVLYKSGSGTFTFNGTGTMRTRPTWRRERFWSTAISSPAPSKFPAERSWAAPAPSAPSRPAAPSLREIRSAF
jgi:autotransporter-associated beta strand protein